jgi:hypothetical protein
MRRHELDVASLVTGLVFVAIAVVYLVSAYTDTNVSAGWVLPLGLIGLGLAGLAGSLRRGLRSELPSAPAAAPVSKAPQEPPSEPGLS